MILVYRLYEVKFQVTHLVEIVEIIYEEIRGVNSQKISQTQVWQSSMIS